MAWTGGAAAEGLVLVMREDGRLETDRQASRLLLFAPEPEAEPSVPAPDALASASPAIPGGQPTGEILAEIEATAARYAGHAALREAGLGASDWLLLYQANIEVESGYDPGAVSPVGAVGLGQLMPSTAAVLRVDPRDWRQNLDGSARYLLAQLARFGTPELALAAYNAGPEAVLEHGGIPPFPETQGHVRKVLTVVQRLRGEIG